MLNDIKIAVIGGSGLYHMPGLEDKTQIRVKTPFGEPSSDILIGTLRGKQIAFLARHGTGHTYTPSTVPYRANIYALKELGVRFIVSVSACGSLREDYAPGHLVVPDQLFDHTKSDRGGRSFFDIGLVAHVSVADPFCPAWSRHLAHALRKTEAIVHEGGTFITIEGPRFSTKGESAVYRQWGCSLIGMTTSPEAFLAREAEIAYGVIAHITDYDVWHESEEPVTVEKVLQTVSGNIKLVEEAIAYAVETLDVDADYASHHALQTAITTAPSHIPDDVKERLKPLIAKYL